MKILFSSSVVLVLMFVSSLYGINAVAAESIDWTALEFECKEEQTPAFDEEADAWYRTARNLQKSDESANANEIVELYRRASEKNHYNAMHRLALLYIDGVGVARDERAAVDLVQRIIELDIPSGYYQMGVFLQQGIGVKADQPASLAYMRKAADMGNPQAQYAIGKKLLAIEEEAVRSHALPIGEAMLQCALQQRLADAGYELGMQYAIVDQDTPKALRAFQSSAALGHRQSLFTLSLIFEEGRYGVAKDAQRSACYSRLKAEMKRDSSKTFPNIDNICPLPPKPMPTQ